MIYPSRRSFLASFRQEGMQASLFVPSDQAVSPGSRVALAVTLRDCETKFEVAGKVTFSRPATRGVGQEAGFGVSFAGEEKRAVAQVASFCAGGSRVPRFTARVPCVVVTDSNRVVGRVLDVSAEGAFIGSERGRMTRCGEVELRLEPRLFGLFARSLKARVVWIGIKHGQNGFGVRFLGAPSSFRSAIERYLHPPGARG